MTTSEPGQADCPNCGRRLDGPFCAGCGQKAAPLNPSVGAFLHDLSHELLHFDGKIVQSVRLLLAKPGFLTREIFEGRRVRHISPVRLYLVFSVLYFAVAALLGPGNAVRVTERPEAGENPAEIEQRVRAVQTEVNTALIQWAPRAMFLLVPVFAGPSRWRRGRPGGTVHSTCISRSISTPSGSSRARWSPRPG